MRIRSISAAGIPASLSTSCAGEPTPSPILMPWRRNGLLQIGRFCKSRLGADVLEHGNARRVGGDAVGAGDDHFGLAVSPCDGPPNTKEVVPSRMFSAGLSPRFSSAMRLTNGATAASSAATSGTMPRRRRRRAFWRNRLKSPASER